MPGLGREARATRNRTTDGGRNNVVESEEQRLGANWQSALCVTSVYDAMAQLQQENEALREQLRVAKQTHEIIAAKAAEAEQMREPERVSVCEQHEEEIRLLRKEKLQLERTSEQQLSILETQLREAEMTYQQQVAKYQEKYALDPNAAKRAALSVQTLRDTLEKVVEEKEELAIRFSQLNCLYTTLQQENATTVKLLQENIARLKAQRGMQRVVAVLSRWSASNLERAWRVWTTQTRTQRIQLHERSNASQVQTRLQEYARRLFTTQLKYLEEKSAAKTTRLAFDRLRKYAALQRRHRQNIHSISELRFTATTKKILLAWKKFACIHCHTRDGIEKIYFVVYRHAIRRSLRKWFHRTHAEQPFNQAVRENTQLQAMVNELKAALDATRGELECLREENEKLQATHSLYKKSTEELAQLRYEVEFTVKEKVGRFLSRQSDRQLLSNVLRQWQTVTMANKNLKRRVANSQKIFQIHRLQCSVVRWRQAIQVQRNYTSVIQRLRNFAVARCFNSWKLGARYERSRKTALRVVIARIRNQLASRCFQQWREYQICQSEARWRLQRVIQLVDRRQLSQGFTKWKKKLHQLQLADSQQQYQSSHLQLKNFYYQQKQHLILLQRSFHQWHQYVRDKQRRMILIKTYAARVQNANLVRAMRSWSEFCYTRNRSRELVRRWIHRSYTSQLQTAWMKWKHQIVNHVHSTSYSALQFEHDLFVENIREQLAQAAMMREELLQRAEQKKSQYDISQRVTREKLLSVKRQQKRMAGAIDTLFVHQRKRSLMKQAIMSWRSASYSKIIGRRKVESHLSRLQWRRTQLVFEIWKQQTRKKKQVEITAKKLVEHHEVYLIGVTFTALFEYKERQKQIKAFTRKYLLKLNKSCVVAIFNSWRKLTRINYLLRTSISRVMLRSTVQHVKEAFTFWLTAAKETADNERRERRNQILAVIQARISVTWKLSVVRTAFSSWKTHVVQRKSISIAETRLRDIYHRWILQQCLSSWAMGIDRDVMLKAWLRRWMEKTVLQKQDLAFRVWKSQVLRTQMEDVHELRLLCETQQGEVSRYREEVNLLRASVALSNQQLAIAQASQTETNCELELLERKVQLHRHFGEWKLWARKVSEQLRVVCMAAKLRRRRNLAVMFRQWEAFVIYRHREIESRVKQCQIRLLFQCFIIWRARAAIKKDFRLKIYQRKIQRSIRIKKQVLQMWREQICWLQDVSKGGKILDRFLWIIILRSSLYQWRRHVIELSNSAQVTKAKQRNLNKFIDQVRTRRCAQVLNEWRSISKIMRKRRDQAYAQYQFICLNLKRKLFRCWVNDIALQRDRHKFLRRLICIRVKFLHRGVFRKWERFAHACIVERINSEKAEAIINNNQAMSEIETLKDNTKQLRASLSTQQQHLQDAEARLSEVLLLSASKASSNTAAFKQSTALCQILLDHLVDRKVGRAFRIWTNIVSRIERNKTGATILATRWNRLRRQRGFKVWRTRVAILHQIDILRGERHKRLLRASIQAWRQIPSKRATAMLFLARRLLRFLAGTQRLGDTFRFWKLLTRLQQTDEDVLHLQNDIQLSQNCLRKTRQQLLLSKWCWAAYSYRLSQMRSFITRCRTISAISLTSEHQRVLRDLSDKHMSDLQVCRQKTAQEMQRSLERATEDACVCESIVSGPSIRAIQAFLRRASQAMTIHDLFASVGVVGQFIHGTTAILFFLDPSSNELWTQREHDRTIQVPVSIGITGCTLSSGTMIDVDNILQDPRFHPMVDQLVLGEVRGVDLCTNPVMGSRASLQRKHYLDSNAGPIGLLSIPLLSADGAVYGVLQVAVPTTSTATKANKDIKIQAQLFVRMCATSIEQLMEELLRNSRDRVRSRIPDRFAKLFKQNKNWRKYYAAMERKYVAIQDQLRTVTNQHQTLADESSEARRSFSALKEKLESCRVNEKEYAKQVALWKKKLLKMKALLDEKEAVIALKTRELQSMSTDFNQFRRQQRAKELDAMLRSPQEVVGQRREQHINLDGGEVSDKGELAMLRADFISVKNQLVRAESDNLLLVRALDMARQNDGQLPAGISHEVSRIAIRVTKETRVAS